jgi:hypothetical protein
MNDPSNLCMAESLLFPNMPCGLKALHDGLHEHVTKYERFTWLRGDDLQGADYGWREDLGEEGELSPRLRVAAEALSNLEWAYSISPGWRIPWDGEEWARIRARAILEAVDAVDREVGRS